MTMLEIGPFPSVGQTQQMGFSKKLRNPNFPRIEIDESRTDSDIDDFMKPTIFLRRTDFDF